MTFFFLKLAILCVVGRRKREEDSDQSKRGIDMYPMKQRHHMSPERDSESHDISCGHGKESTRWKPHKKRKIKVYHYQRRKPMHVRVKRKN